MYEHGLELGGVTYRHATTLTSPITRVTNEPEGVPEEFPTPERIVRTGGSFL